MRPILFEIFGVPISAYGTVLALAFIAGMFYVQSRADKDGVDQDTMLDMGFYVLISGILGARLLYIIVEWDVFSADWREMYRLWNGGMVFYGGIIGSTIVGAIYTRVKKLNTLKIVDYYFETGPLGIGIARFGCLFAGCCHGKPTALPWGIPYFTRIHMEQFQNIRVHPSPMYEALFCFALFFFMRFISARKKFDGQMMAIFMILYPLGRFTLEFFRGDARGVVAEPIFSKLFAPLLENQTITNIHTGLFESTRYLSTSQFISVIIALLGAVFLVAGLKRAKSKDIPQ